MKETVTTATKAFILTAKMKAFIAFFSLLLVGGGLYVLADPAGQSIVTAKDPYTLDIQNRAQTINNAVLGVIDAHKTQPAYKFRTTCEDAVFLIRKKNLEAEQENLKLTPEQRALNVKYKAFLHEAYIVVDDCYNGKQADLAAMNKAKVALY
jgi:hypothetical protein